MKFWQTTRGVGLSLLFACSAPPTEPEHTRAEAQGIQCAGCESSIVEPPGPPASLGGTVESTYDAAVSVNQADGDGEVVLQTIDVITSAADRRIIATALLFLDVTADTRPTVRLLVTGGPYLEEQISLRILNENAAGTMVTMMGRAMLPVADTYHVSLIASTDGWPGATLSSVGTDDALIVTVLKN